MGTRVLEVQEVYKLIPEAKKLENKSFTNLKDLLEQLVEAIEQSGKWEFVNFITNKPSLCIIRKREQPVAVNYQDYTMKSTSLLDIKTEVAKQTKVTQETKDTPLIDIKPMESKFPVISKLPWETE